MIFSLLKLIIWLAGVGVIAYFMLPYFDYELNWNYWNERKVVCQEALKQCRQDIFKNGWNGAKETCNWQCIDPKLIIKKQ